MWSAAIVLLVLGLLLWERDRHAFVQTLQPDYRVTHIDYAAETMVLQKENHNYVVICAENCPGFSVGRAYGMRNVVNGLEFRATDRVISLPIVQEDVTFPAEGGKG